MIPDSVYRSFRTNQRALAAFVAAQPPRAKPTRRQRVAKWIYSPQFLSGYAIATLLFIIDGV